MTTTSPLTTADLVAMLRAGVHGDVVTPDDASFPAAAFGQDVSATTRPELVVIVADAADAASTVRVAARAGRRVVVQAGRQAASGGPGTILIVTRLLAHVRIDPTARTATVGAGASWRQVLAAAEPFGLAPISGSTDREPVARSFTFAADQIRELQVVTALGDLISLDVRRDRESFQVLRRATAAFGLVTAVTVDLVPLSRLVTSRWWFPAEAAGELKRRRQDWSAELPAPRRTAIGRRPVRG